MREKVLLRVDTTATPDRADGKAPDSDMIYEYSVTDALADATGSFGSAFLLAAKVAIILRGTHDRRF